jgi:hypothetical protein
LRLTRSRRRGGYNCLPGTAGFDGPTVKDLAGKRRTRKRRGREEEGGKEVGGEESFRNGGMENISNNFVVVWLTRAGKSRVRDNISFAKGTTYALVVAKRRLTD